MSTFCTVGQSHSVLQTTQSQACVHRARCKIPSLGIKLHRFIQISTTVMLFPVAEEIACDIKDQFIYKEK